MCEVTQKLQFYTFFYPLNVLIPSLCSQQCNGLAIFWLAEKTRLKTPIKRSKIKLLYLLAPSLFLLNRANCSACADKFPTCCQRDKGKYINRYQSSTAALLTENKSVQSREGPWCTFCNGNHPSSNCTIVTDISARKQILRRRGKCFKCLKTGHLVRDCKSGKPCYNCGNNHHTSICETHSKPRTHPPQSVNPNIPQQRNPPFVPLRPSTNMLVHQPPYYPVGPPCHSNTPHVPNASAFPFTPQQTNVSSSNPFVPTYPATNMHAPQFPYSPGNPVCPASTLHLS